MRTSPSLVLIPVLLLAACQAGGAPPASPKAEAEARLTRKAIALKGTVLAPADLIGTDAGALIGPDGASLVGPDGASLVGPDGASMVAAGAGNYAALQAPAAAGAVPLANATVFLATADGSPVSPPVVGKTDARGRFAFATAPTGRYVVVALARTASKRAARLLALATAITEDTTVDVSVATTLVTTAALNRREGPIAGYDPGTYGRAVALAAAGLADGGAPDLGDRGALAAAVERLAGAADLGPLIAKLRAEVVGAPRPRTPYAPATAEPTPALLAGSGSALINVPQPTSAPGDDPGAGPTVDPGQPPVLDTPPPVAPVAPPTPPPAPVYEAGVEVETLSGGDAGFADGGSTARYNAPGGIGVGTVGTLYIGDSGNHTVRMLEPLFGLWEVKSPWGQGPGFATSPAKGARFNAPRGVSVVPAAGRYVADTGNHLVRYLPISGNVEAVAGVPNAGPGFLDGPAAQARFSSPTDVSYQDGDVVITDSGNHRIRKLSGGQVTTVAGDGTAGFADGPAAGARFDGPLAATTDLDGVVYVADTNNHRIRKIANGQVTTLAGDGTAGFADGPGASARFHTPSGIAVTLGGELVVADRGNRRLRFITPDGRVTTLAGTGATLSADGAGSQAAFVGPVAVAIHPLADKAYVVDGHRIRKVTF